MSDITFIPLGKLLSEQPSYGANTPATPLIEGWPRYIRITDITETGELIDSDIKGIDPGIAIHYLLEEGDILIARSGNTVGKSYIHRDYKLRAAHAGYLIKFRVDRKKAWPFFVFHYLHSSNYWSWVQSASKVAAQPNINATQYCQLPIPEINPEHQRAIATILDTMDEAIRRTEAVIAKLRQVKAGMLHDLLTRGLDENGELREPIRHPEQFKDSPLGRIPKTWEVNSLGSLIQELEAGVSVNAWDRPAGGGELGVLKTSCVVGGAFLSEENKTVFPRDKSRVSCPVKANSIIISRMNTPLLVGESGYVDTSYPGLYLPDRLWQTVMREEKGCSVKWLCYVLNWEPVRKQIRDIATGTSGSMKNISKGVFLALDIRIPKTGEQEAVVERIEDVDESLRTETKKCEKLNLLKQGLMQDLLTGQVRVPEAMLLNFQEEVVPEG